LDGLWASSPQPFRKKPEGAALGEKWVRGGAVSLLAGGGEGKREMHCWSAAAAAAAFICAV